MTGSPHRHVVIIGAMKSGTTTLFDHLARHPGIAPAATKEPGFFAFDGVFAQGPDWFDALFEGAAPDAWRLEASTDYTKAPFVEDVARRMKTHGGEFRLLYIMRDPLARIESHARHVQRTRKEIGQSVSPRPDHGLDAGLSALSLAVSDYARQLDVWRPAFDAGRLHCLTLEDLTRAPEATMAQVWRFLDLDPAAVAAPLPQSNAGDARRRTPNRVLERLTAMRAVSGAGKRLLPKSTRETIKRAFSREVRLGGRFTLTGAERDTLQAFYAPGVERMARAYGFDARALWGFGAGDGAEGRPEEGTAPLGKRV